MLSLTTFTQFFVKPSVTSNASPLQQLRSGITATDVICNQGFHLMIRNQNGYPACVSEETLSKLIERGWGVIPLHGLPVR